MAIELVFLQMLNALKIRAHSASSPDMPYDEKYTEYFEQFGLLPFITTVTRSTPNERGRNHRSCGPLEAGDAQFPPPGWRDDSDSSGCVNDPGTSYQGGARVREH